MRVSIIRWPRESEMRIPPLYCHIYLLVWALHGYEWPGMASWTKDGDDVIPASFRGLYCRVPRQDF